ncbi:MAG: FHA domain-containing protein [Ectothiorhodospiraceae bacterium]|nr:FHA domain-containing protein [Ectothiorhodospiraceae bacterium]
MAALIQFKGNADGITLRLESLESHIGRGVDNDITINDELVSKQHAVIEARQAEGKSGGFEYFIKDCDSTNGTFINDKRIEAETAEFKTSASCQLYHDDVIRIGVNHFRFVDDANDDLAATTRIHKTWIPGLYISKRGK